jgi:hypothetical protein
MLPPTRYRAEALSAAVSGQQPGPIDSRPEDEGQTTQQCRTHQHDLADVVAQLELPIEHLVPPAIDRVDRF